MNIMQKQKERVALISMLSSAVLAIGKFAIGFLTGSIGLILRAFVRRPISSPQGSQTKPPAGCLQRPAGGFVVVVAIAAALAPALLPTDDRIGGEGRSVAAGVIFVGSYLALAIGRIPGLSIDRAGIALVGAGLMVASGALPLEDA
jgi:hypothetical protein